MKKQNNITKKIYFDVFLSLLPIKKKRKKIDGKHFILAKKRTLRKTCMSVLQFDKNQKEKNTKTSVKQRSFLHTKKLKLMNKTFNFETEIPYQMYVLEKFLRYQNAGTHE